MLRLPVSRISSCKVTKIVSVTFARGVQTISSDTAGEKPKPRHYDIIIAGGGLVGTTLACSLGKQSLWLAIFPLIQLITFAGKNKILGEKNILLLEGGPKFKGFSGGEYANRVSALNNGTINLFKSIGAWDTIASARYKPVKQMHVRFYNSNSLFRKMLMNFTILF